MSLHAVDDVSDAFQATRAFLSGRTAGQWLRLAVIAFLTGGVTAPNAGYQFNAGQVTPGAPGTPGSVFGPRLGAVIVGFVVVAVVVGILLAILGSILEFAFVEALRSDEIAIRRNVDRYWGKGLRLLVFNLGVGLVVVAAFALAVVPLVFMNALSVVALVVFLPVAFVVALAAFLVNGFTRAFVVPIMVLEERNVLPAWRRLWGVLREHPKEYGVFVLVNFALTIVGGIFTAIGAIVALIVVAIPVGIVFGIPFALAGGSGALAWTWLAIGVFLGALAFFLGIGLVNAPVQSYLRYYAILLVGDTTPDLDLVPERRAAIRSDGGDTDVVEE